MLQISNEAQLIETRAFERGDLNRMISWAVLGNPKFMGGQVDDARIAKHNAIDFLSSYGAQFSYSVICAKGDFCRHEFKRATGLPLSGAIAVINTHTGETFVDPALRDHVLLGEVLERTSRTYAPALIPA